MKEEWPFGIQETRFGDLSQLNPQFAPHTIVSQLHAVLGPIMLGREIPRNVDDLGIEGAMVDVTDESGHISISIARDGIRCMYIHRESTKRRHMAEFIDPEKFIALLRGDREQANPHQILQDSNHTWVVAVEQVPFEKTPGTTHVTVILLKLTNEQYRHIQLQVDDQTLSEGYIFHLP